MTLSKQPTVVPDELKQPLEPMRIMENETPSQMWEVYRHNTEQCSVCYVRYKALVEAVESREAGD